MCFGPRPLRSGHYLRWRSQQPMRRNTNNISWNPSQQARQKSWQICSPVGRCRKSKRYKALDLNHQALRTSRISNNNNTHVSIADLFRWRRRNFLFDCLERPAETNTEVMYVTNTTSKTDQNHQVFDQFQHHNDNTSKPKPKPTFTHSPLTNCRSSLHIQLWIMVGVPWSLRDGRRNV